MSMPIAFVLFLISAMLSVVFILIFLIGIWKVKNINELSEIVNDDSLPTLTILICAKNEEKNLRSNLPQIINQNYPKEKFNIIVINDSSEDNTEMIIKDFSKQYSVFEYYTIHKNEIRTLPGKKFALQYGISKVNSEMVLLTDADCIPSSNEWAKLMVKKSIQTKAKIILGYGAYQYNSSHFLSKFIQWETLHTVMQYSAYAIIGIPYMGVGRNLLYHTEILNKAFNDKYLLYKMKMTSSGDDDMVISHLHNEKIVPYIDSNAMTISNTVDTINDYLHQKRRHTSSSKYYPLLSKFLLGVYALNHFAFYTLFIICIYYYRLNDFLVYVLFIFAFKSLFSAVNYSHWKNVTTIPISVFSLLIMDIFWTIYNVILSPFIFWKNKLKWK